MNLGALRIIGMVFCNKHILLNDKAYLVNHADSFFCWFDIFLSVVILSDDTILVKKIDM